jgi:glycerol-3-phosphate acyltransferase PlsY
MTLSALALCAGAYVLGGVPTGVLFGRIAGRDPRAGGSGNIGATNVTRTLGRAWGAATLVVDLLKGLAPVLAAHALADADDTRALAAAAGLSAVIGHCYSPFLRLRGGKGVATAFGAMLGLAWPIASLAAVLWVAVVVIGRVAALGSLAAMACFVAVAFLDDQPSAVQAFALLTAALVTVRHADNIRALRQPRPAHRMPRAPKPPKRRAQRR